MERRGQKQDKRGEGGKDSAADHVPGLNRATAQYVSVSLRSGKCLSGNHWLTHCCHDQRHVRTSPWHRICQPLESDLVGCVDYGAGLVGRAIG
jgi:hypothetical protein